MYVVTVQFNIQAERAADFHAAVLRQAASSLQHEPGCRQFDVCVAEANARMVFLYELYDDAETFQNHLNTQHFLEFDELVRDWVEEKTVACWNRL